MPTTLTLKNIPDVVYERLKQSAELHRRSLSNEVIVCLETVLLPVHVRPAERLARARALHAVLPLNRYGVEDIDAAKSRGRRSS